MIQNLACEVMACILADMTFEVDWDLNIKNKSEPLSDYSETFTTQLLLAQ